MRSTAGLLPDRRVLRGMLHFKMGSVICARKSTLLNWCAAGAFHPGR